MGKIENDKYYTSPELAKELIELTYNTIGNNWDRIIEPSAGMGSFLQFLPKNTIAYDIEPQLLNIIQADYRTVKLPYIEKSLVIGNPPFGSGNMISRQFVKSSLSHSPYIAFIQPISQLNNNITMTNTELLLSMDLGLKNFSNKKLHTCFNIYHYKKNGHKQNYEIPDLEISMIYRNGITQSSKEKIENNWDYRIGAYGTIKLLNEDEYCSTEIVIKAKNKEMKLWVDKIMPINFKTIIQTTSGNRYRLPVWRVKKYFYEKYNEIS